MKERAHDEDDNYEDLFVESNVENDDHTADRTPLNSRVHDENDGHKYTLLEHMQKTMGMMLVWRKAALVSLYFLLLHTMCFGT